MTVHGHNECDRPPRVCGWCEETLEPNILHTGVGSAALHHECATRMIVGSVAHIEGRCSCFIPGSTEGDDRSLTRREAARAAKELFEQRAQI